MLRDINYVVARLPHPGTPELPAPEYTGRSGRGIALAVESMKRHMTDEGWQIMQAVESQGYTLCGDRCPLDSVDVPTIIANTQPGVVIVQDKREWDVSPKDFRDKAARFNHVGVLADHSDIFKLTILKDSHQRPDYHRESAQEIGCHAWIVYYHPRIVKHVAPYVRSEHLVRTYHSLDPALVPDYTPDNRRGCLISGAVSPVYPLRSLLIRKSAMIPNCEYLRHPGYHRNGCATPGYLQMLSQFKVAICTSSVYGYTLRKIIEATACGCVVLTDLPTDEVLPEIDANLIRIPHEIHPQYVAQRVVDIYRTYNVDHQREMAERAKAFYNYRAIGSRLVQDIETLRGNYAGSSR